jgi:hypothetical protein
MAIIVQENLRGSPDLFPSHSTQPRFHNGAVRLLDFRLGMLQPALFLFQQIVKLDKQLMECLCVFFNRNLSGQSVELCSFFRGHFQG